MADIISKIPDKLFSLQVKLYVNAAIFSLRISKETSNCRDNVVLPIHRWMRKSV